MIFCYKQQLWFAAIHGPGSVPLADTNSFAVRRPPRWRRGNGLDCGSRSGSDSRHTLTACGPSDVKEVKDVFGRPGARVGVGSAR